MKRKILLLALVILLLLPATGFTGDVEITDVKLKWKTDTPYAYKFLGKIVVTNHGATTYLVSGALIFYDRDQFVLYKTPFFGRAKGGGNTTFDVSGLMTEKEYKEIDHHEARINTSTPTRF